MSHLTNLVRATRPGVDTLYVLPLLAFIVSFLLYPVAFGFWLSLHETQGLEAGALIGFDNYLEALTGDGLFHQAIRNTIGFTIAAVILQTAIGLGLALLLASVRRGRTLYRVIFFAPFVVAPAAVGAVWKWIYAPYFGLASNGLSAIGLSTPDQSLLANQDTALAAVMVAVLWRFVGFNTVIYLAALQSMPKDLLEHAELEGASWLQRLRHVIWPLLLPQTYTIVFLTTVGTLRIFDTVWLMTKGGPAHSTETVATYMYVTAFRYFRLGYAQSLGFLLILLSVGLAIVLFMTLKRRADEIAL